MFYGLRQVLRDIRTQKLRTFLTTFGIVWGTVSISLLLAFGQGFHESRYKSFAGLGEYIVIAWPSRTSLPFHGLGKGRRIRISHEDVALVRARARDLLAISAEYGTSLKLNYGPRTLSVDVAGVEPCYGELRNLVPESGGRFINVIDEQRRRRVAFIGDELATRVFDTADPVGQTVMLAGSPFTIVGVLQHKDQDSNYSGRDTGKLFMPASTFRALTGRKYVNDIIFKAHDVRRTESLKADVLSILAGRHRFDPEDREALSMWDTTEMFQFLDTFMYAFRAFLGIIGILTLVVGGVGVSNIMHVVVEERTREIGIKMALGARGGSILRQLMLETLLITISGGALGLLVSAGICAVFPSFGLGDFVGVPQISPPVAILTASLLGLVALAAGFFPARQASRLDPVVAMKG